MGTSPLSTVKLSHCFVVTRCLGDVYCSLTICLLKCNALQSTVTLPLHLFTHHRPYNNMTLCMEMLSGLLGCYYPNPGVQDFFLHIHSQYFSDCSEEELQLSDAPHSVVVVLTLLPVSLIPIPVFLVVWKSKVRD